MKCNGEWVTLKESLTKEVTVKIDRKPATKEEREEILLKILEKYYWGLK